MSKYPLGINSSMIKAAESLLLAMAFERQIKAVVTEYESAILSRLQLRSAKKYMQFGIDKIILDRKDSFLLSEEDLSVFLQESFKARDAANLVVSHPENCPLLEAKNLLIAAENNFLRALSEHPDFSKLSHAIDAGTLTLEDREKFIDLALRLVVPFVSSHKEILNSVMQDGNKKE